MASSPRVGVGVFAVRAGRFLMGRRRGAHGEGTWSLPGGHLEYGESFETAAAREVLEETGLTVSSLRPVAVTNDVFAAESRHYVTVWMLSTEVEGTPEVREPDKFVAQSWFDLDTLPVPLFLPWEQLLRSPFIAGIRTALAAGRS
ncbi:nucleotide triphosphate diphosphatase NUDT15 [Dactylosporangium sp. CA-139066]|uniref:nucleotide triphosphate diphosphatase NUDT15 n=1 Tax=Dactylosporangium sp. CA-139066 TaxID=3239930 RepID=UPI003D8C731A